MLRKVWDINRDDQSCWEMKIILAALIRKFHSPKPFHHIPSHHGTPSLTSTRPYLIGKTGPPVAWMAHALAIWIKSAQLMPQDSAMRWWPKQEAQTFLEKCFNNGIIQIQSSMGWKQESLSRLDSSVWKASGSSQLWSSPRWLRSWSPAHGWWIHWHPLVLGRMGCAGRSCRYHARPGGPWWGHSCSHQWTSAGQLGTSHIAPAPCCRLYKGIANGLAIKIGDDESKNWTKTALEKRHCCRICAIFRMISCWFLGFLSEWCASRLYSIAIFPRHGGSCLNQPMDSANPWEILGWWCVAPQGICIGGWLSSQYSIFLGHDGHDGHDHPLMWACHPSRHQKFWAYLSMTWWPSLGIMMGILIPIYYNHL